MQTNSVNPAGLKGFEFSPGFSSTVSSSCSRFRSSRSFLLGLPRFRFFPSGAGAFFVFFVFFYLILLLPFLCFPGIYIYANTKKVVYAIPLPFNLAIARGSSATSIAISSSR